jgi:hypothetical protein
VLAAVTGESDDLREIPSARWRSFFLLQKNARPSGLRGGMTTAVLIFKLWSTAKRWCLEDRSAGWSVLLRRNVESVERVGGQLVGSHRASGVDPDASFGDRIAGHGVGVGT